MSGPHKILLAAAIHDAEELTHRVEPECAARRMLFQWKRDGSRVQLHEEKQI